MAQNRAFSAPYGASITKPTYERTFIMSEFENFSVELTREPFEGEFSAPYGGRILYGPHGKILGTVSGKRICDLNGHELAV